MNEQFGEQYYKSANYLNYLQRRFYCLACDVVDEIKIEKNERVIDFGCGYGGLLEEIWKLGYKNIVGTDISQWAIDYGKKTMPHVSNLLQYYNRNLLTEKHECLILLDVLEHIPEFEIDSILSIASISCNKYAVVRIPISKSEGESFVLNVSNNDPTHITCHTRIWWHNMAGKHGWKPVKKIVKQSIYDSDGVMAELWETDTRL